MEVSLFLLRVLSRSMRMTGIVEKRSSKNFSSLCVPTPIVPSAPPLQVGHTAGMCLVIPQW